MTLSEQGNRYRRHPLDLLDFEVNCLVQNDLFEIPIEKIHGSRSLPVEVTAWDD